MTRSPSLSFATARRPPRRRLVRILSWTVILAVVAAVVVAATGGLLWIYAWMRLGGSGFPTLEAGADEALGAGGASSPVGTTTVLLAITEERDPTDPSGVPLAGPVALVQVGGSRGDAAAVLVLPPQLRVSVDGESPMALSEVHELGGADLLLRSVVDYTQIEIDHVVAASTTAVPELVDALGPVVVCATTCDDVDADGARAIVEVFGAAASPRDASTALAQLAQVVEQLAGEVDLVGVLTSPLASKRAIDVLADHVETDVSLRGASLLTVSERLAGTHDVAVVSLPGVLNPDSGQLVVLPEQAAVRFALLREGGVPTDVEEDDEAALLAGATVAVQNGTGTTGFAAVLEAQLAAAGIRVVGTENASNFSYERSVVRYGPDDPSAEAAAILVARELGDVELEELDRAPTFEGEPVTVQIIGGADLDEES